MSEPSQARRYDRALLLGPKRDELLELWEVERYGRDSFGDPDYVCVYGLKPHEWYGRGVRLLGRTVVECTRDRLAARISRDVAAVAPEAATGRTVVVDPFAGSGNTLLWLARRLRPESRSGSSSTRPLPQLRSETSRCSSCRSRCDTSPTNAGSRTCRSTRTN